MPLKQLISRTAPDTPRSESSEDLLLAGSDLIEKGLRRAAQPLLKQALEQEPAKRESWLAYIQLLIELGQHEDAQSVIRQGESFGLTGDDVAALKARSRSPDHKQLTELDEALQKQNWTCLEQAATALITEFPDHPAGWRAAYLAHRQRRAFDKAWTALTRLNELLPDDVNLLSDLGLLSKLIGKISEAESHWQRSIAIEPTPAACINLGNLLVEQQRQDEAKALAEQALHLNPGSGEALQLLSAIHMAQGSYINAVQTLENALQLAPMEAPLWVNLACAYIGLEQYAASEPFFLKALGIDPELAGAHMNYGAVLAKLRRFAEAEQHLSKSLALNPRYIQAAINLGAVYLHLNANGQAESILRAALSWGEPSHELLNNLATALEAQDKNPEEVESLAKRAVTLKPDYADAWVTLGNFYQKQGRHAEAMTALSRGFALNPRDPRASGALLFLTNYHPDLSDDEVSDHYQQVEAQGFLHWYPVLPHQYENLRRADRKIRVGYCSPDFRRHSARHFIEPLFANHDKSRFEIFAYAEIPTEDDYTQRYKGYVDHWRTTHQLNDDALVALIKEDQIDILVDLAGHTGGNRLSVFARKPAPISMTWLGYGCTTGLKAIDYILTDEISLPVGAEKHCAEKPLRVAAPNYAYRPPENTGEVGALPALQNGYVTFGCLSRAVRINHRTIRVWSELLRRLPSAKIRFDSFNYQHASARSALLAEFAKHGIHEDRLIIGFESPPWNVYRSVDLALDCFPHNSGTTLIEGLYMGVPYVTLAGRPIVGRIGSAILHGVGRPEWIALTEQEYVEKLVELAGDLTALAAIRSNLRGEMEASPLMDEVGFARKVEKAFLEVFNEWCKQST